MRVVRYGAGSSAAASTSSAPATQPATHSLAQASVGLLHDTVQWLHHGSDTVTAPVSVAAVQYSLKRRLSEGSQRFHI